jgi:hypothetical protein
VLKVYAIYGHRPEFIMLQQRSFARHLSVPFEFTVINNAVFASDPRHRSEIERAAAQVGVRTIQVQKDFRIEGQYPERIFDRGNQDGYFNANVANAYPLAWAWDKEIAHQTDTVLIVHSDMFLIDTLDIDGWKAQGDLAYVPQVRGRYEYMWDGFAMLNMPNLPNPQSIQWWCGILGEEQEHVDVGGLTTEYLRVHPEVKRFHIPHVHVSDDLELNFHPARYEILDNRILHYCSGSNWNQQSAWYHNEKTEWLKARLA